MKQLFFTLLILTTGFLLYSIDFNSDEFEINHNKINLKGSNIELKNAAFEEYKRADETLNKVYQEILKQYNRNKNFITQLIAAQKVWIKYRDLHMFSIFPFNNSDSDPQIYVGSGYGYAYYISLSEITWIRVKLLYKWIDENIGFGSDGVYEEYEPSSFGNG